MLADYCERNRAHELVVVDMEDDLYASALPLERLRYCIVGAGVLGGRYEMPFDYMGIVETAAQFDDPARWTPIFRQHLSEWGIHSDEPIGTVITVGSAEELAQMIQAHPDTDFLLPDRNRQAVEEATRPTHELVPGAGHFFLLSRRDASRSGQPAWSCRL